MTSRSMKHLGLTLASAILVGAQTGCEDMFDAALLGLAGSADLWSMESTGSSQPAFTTGLMAAMNSDDQGMMDAFNSTLNLSYGGSNSSSGGSLALAESPIKTTASPSSRSSGPVQTTPPKSKPPEYQGDGSHRSYYEHEAKLNDWAAREYEAQGKHQKAAEHRRIAANARRKAQSLQTPR